MILVPCPIQPSQSPLAITPILDTAPATNGERGAMNGTDGVTRLSNFGVPVSVYTTWVTWITQYELRQNRQNTLKHYIISTNLLGFSLCPLCVLLH